MPAQGSAVVDFGAEAADRASVAVTGQTGILSTSDVEAYFMSAGTAENDADAHILANSLMSLTAGGVTAGVGFTISALCQARATGKFNIKWVWS